MLKRLSSVFQAAGLHLALLVTVMTFDALKMPRGQIIGITMPGFGTTDRTYTNACDLIRSLGVTLKEIPIKEACLQHFRDIDHDPSVHDVTYENSQARERTQLLMDVANQKNGLVIGTGDLSELALGWATYNGDHMSMYGVNGSIPKTLVKYLVEWVANHKVDDASRLTLLDIVDTPISPELIPADENGNIKQKTEDLVGPYELHDFFLYHFLRFGSHPSKIYFLAQKPSQASTTMQRSRNGSTPSSAASSNNNSNAVACQTAPRSAPSASHHVVTGVCRAMRCRDSGWKR